MTALIERASMDEKPAMNPDVSEQSSARGSVEKKTDSIGQKIMKVLRKIGDVITTLGKKIWANRLGRAMTLGLIPVTIAGLFVLPGGQALAGALIGLTAGYILVTAAFYAIGTCYSSFLCYNANLGSTHSIK